MSDQLENRTGIRSVAGLVGGLALAMFAAGAQASIIYNIDRTIGSGTVQGTVTTDGTIGTLSAGNIESWSVTVTHPNLRSGSPHSMSAIGLGSGQIRGDALTASLTQLTFDFSHPGVDTYFHLYDGITYWCNAGADQGGCGDSVLSSVESVGFLNSFDLPYEVAHRGAVVIASVGNVNVPEPGSLALVGLAIAGLAGLRRRTA